MVLEELFRKWFWDKIKLNAKMKSRQKKKEKKRDDNIKKIKYILSLVKT